MWKKRFVQPRSQAFVSENTDPSVFSKRQKALGTMLRFVTSRKVSEKSLDLASPVLFEERRDIVDLQSPLRCDTPNLSFISPSSSSLVHHAVQALNGTNAVSRLICLGNGTVYI